MWKRASRIGETYTKVKGQDKYLYRALDSTGQTIEVLLTAKRDKAAAKRFLVQLGSTSAPRSANSSRHAHRKAGSEDTNVRTKRSLHLGTDLRGTHYWP